MIDFSKLFSLYVEPVIVISDDRIIYGNKSAGEFIPGFEEKPLSAIIPAALLPPDMDPFIGEINIWGKKAKFSHVEIDGCKVISFFDVQGEMHTKDSHEFMALFVKMREYLAVLKMAAGVVLPYVENIGDKSLTEYSAMINHSYYNVLRLMENMRILSEEAEDNTASLRLTDFELVRFCADVCDTCSLLISEKHAKISFVSDSESVYVSADREKIEVLLFNLLSNSLLHTDNSDIIKVSLSVSEDSVRLVVSDTGKGVPDENKVSGWSGYREPVDLQDPLKGAGYGLAVVSHIARMHGGGSFFSSAEGKGTTVAVSLPIVKKDTAGFKDELEDYVTKGLNPFLMGLSTVLENDRYTQKYMD